MQNVTIHRALYCYPTLQKNMLQTEIQSAVPTFKLNNVAEEMSDHVNRFVLLDRAVQGAHFIQQRCVSDSELCCLSCTILFRNFSCAAI
jgi:hypothetical protein